MTYEGNGAYSTKGYIPPNVASHTNSSNYQNTVDVQQHSYNERNLEQLSIQIKDNSISHTSLIINVLEKNNLPFKYDQLFILQKKENDTYTNLPRKSTSIGYLDEETIYVTPNELTEIEINWDREYGELPSGNYRLVLYVYDTEKYYLEFTIN